ncbi:Hemerythrin HHE cation binding domain-containing protein [Tranquillimonas rosea]|uniref:Hemerythrin HHE cation binding domain-containing protein n=1 Tax=Tranquillimonas rosea TaxID=641238 RepID=A0A1H9T8S2_9RHOB|nr:hemerythrin domain-containing protein [Tranquillimonas rosea]SER93189.1 Hemerythrin HHE cation binding domain-containing protein [Tranquillimonas rosea]
MGLTDPKPSGRGDQKPSPELFANPLDWIGAEHLHERNICDLIDGLSVAEALDQQSVLSVLRFLNEDLTVHLRDEAEDLFPLLELRCTEEDAISNAMLRIKTDQMEAIRLLPEVRVMLLDCLDTGSNLTAEDRGRLRDFAGHIRQHIVAEKAILLPLARARLTRADLETLSRHMRSRRELSEIAETRDAE